MSGWKVIAGFTDYEVSNAGQIRRATGGQGAIRGKVLRLHLNASGYKTVSLRGNGKANSKLVNRLVAGAFIPNPNKLPEVNHKNGRKSNNHARNLEWVTHAANSAHAERCGLYRTKVSAEQVRKIVALCLTLSQYEVAQRYGISQTHVSRLVLGTRRRGIVRNNLRRQT